MDRCLESMHKLFDKSFVVEGVELYLTASMGLSLFPGR